jgi:endoglucanase
MWFASSAIQIASSADNTTKRTAPELGQCINLGGALEAPNEGDWGYRIRDEDLRTIAQTGFKTVRIPVKWSAHALNQEPFTIDPAFLARVDHVVDEAIANGLTVVLNMHHYDELYAYPDEHLARFTNMWVQLARHYQSYPDAKLIFELINEPKDNFSRDRMSNAQNRLLTMVRKSNPTRTVILSGDHWGSFKGIDHLYVPDDPHIMVSVHDYTPFQFTHQGAGWMDNPPPLGARWGESRDIRALAAFADELAKWQEEKNVPIFLGEFGVITNARMSERAGWTAGFRAAMDAANIPWCYFDFATSFAAYDQRRNRWSPLILNALMPKTPPQ